jgi:adenylylsulfate kinase
LHKLFKCLIFNKNHIKNGNVVLAMKETALRSLIKSLSWRFLATLTTIALVYIFTKDLTVSIGIGGVEVVAKLIIYYFHERAWNHVRFGKKHITPKTQEVTVVKKDGQTRRVGEPVDIYS